MAHLGGFKGERPATWAWGTVFFWVAIASFVLHFTRPAAAVGHMPQVVLQLLNAPNVTVVPVDTAFAGRAAETRHESESSTAN